MIGRKLFVDGFLFVLRAAMGAMSRLSGNFQCNIVWIMRMCENYRRWDIALQLTMQEREEKVNISCFDLCDQLTIQRQCVFMNYSGQLRAGTNVNEFWFMSRLSIKLLRTHATIAHFFFLLSCIIHHRRHRLSSFIKIDFLFAHYAAHFTFKVWPVSASCTA